MLDWLTGWWNWPFLLSFFVGAGLTIVTIAGVGKDVDADHHGLVDVGVGKPGLDKPGLEWLGGGKAPLTLLLEVLLVSFGLIGMFVTAVARQVGLAGLSFPVALVVAALGAIVLTRSLADVLGRLLPGDRTAARKSGDFVGKTGTTASLVTTAIGQVRVVPDDKGPEAVLNACVDATWGRDIQRDTEVMLASYDAEKALYRIRPLIID
jgi:membrane protein implicated in regulation of membrane protease activity